MITAKQDKILREIELLPIELKTEIVDKILNSLMPTSNSIDTLWIKEAHNRKEEVEREEIELIDGQEVFQKIFQRLNS